MRAVLAEVNAMNPIGLDMFIMEAIVLIALLAMLGVAAGRTYRKNRGSRVIICPEDRQQAGVVVDTRHLLLTMLDAKQDLRLKSCSRWPARQDCGQKCVTEAGLRT